MKTKKISISQENKELRRENSRLKKKVAQLEGSIDSLTAHGEEPAAENQKEEEPLFEGCPKCGEQTTGRVELGKYIYLICQSVQCRYRERIGRIKN